MMWDRRWILFSASLTVIAAIFREHWQHVLGLTPYLLLLACPLMHLFHGHGHAGHRHDRESHPKELGDIT
uniref:DUF2933 domain-containing protein n=1 Tax=Ensifer adhaerens TaxID=106592 RepID=UPI003F497096